MLRHGSLRDDRRRRSLLEDVAAPAETGAPAKPRRAKTAEAYTDLARFEAHSRWSDFVPLRNWALLAFFAVGLAAVALLETSYYFARNVSIWSDQVVRALDLARPDSMAGWFAALVMVAAAIIAVFIYSVRRYRLDDYRGRYRVWLGGAVMCLLISLDGVADLRSLAISLGIQLSEHAGPADGVAWWLAPWSLFTLWVGLRMVLEVRACRTATVSLLLSFGFLASALALPYFQLPIGGREMAMVASGCSLLGRWLLLFAEVAFARHVLLDAHGQLPARAPRPKREKSKPQPHSDSSKPTSKSTANKTRDDLTARIDPPHTSAFRPASAGVDLAKGTLPNVSQARSPASNTKVSATASTTVASKSASVMSKTPTQFISGDDGDDDLSNSRKLSRAERKRLRKQQRADRHGDED